MKTPARLPWTLFFVLLISAPRIYAADHPPRIYLGHDLANGTVTVEIQDEHFTTFHYGEEARTPFLWPVKAEGNVGITRNHPMGSDAPESTDHPHHRSLYLTYGDVNGYDHWHEERIDTVSVETGTAGDYAWIRSRNEWLTTDGGPLLRETQEIRFYDTPAAGRVFDIISTLEAASEDVVFGDDKEGMMAFRIRPEIQGNRAGVLTNAEGKQGEQEVYGTPSPWMDYSGPIEGVGVRGIALFDHPGNFRHPTFWHVRDYGLAAANPFGRHSVGGKEEAGDHTLEQGESMTFVYRFYVHSGDVEEAGVAAKYEEFAGETFGSK